MSQALQSLNSILKYRQERERQKIGESLSMLDMGARLTQQKYDREFQKQTIALRTAQERRSVAKDDREKQLADAQLQAANLELQQLRRRESPDMLALQKEKLELSVAEDKATLKLREEQLEEYEQKRSADAYAKVDAGLDESYQEKNRYILDQFKDKGLIPSIVFQEVKYALTDGYDADKDIDAIRTKIISKSEGKQKKYLKELLSRDKYGSLIISGIAASQITEAKGQVNYEPLMESLDEFSLTMLNDAVLMKKMKKAGVSGEAFKWGMGLINQNERNREIIEEAKRSGEFQSSLDRLAKEDVNIEMQELAKTFATIEGLTYFTEDDKRILLNTINPKTGKNFTAEDFE